MLCARTSALSTHTHTQATDAAPRSLGRLAARIHPHPHALCLPGDAQLDLHVLPRALREHHARHGGERASRPSSGSKFNFVVAPSSGNRPCAEPPQQALRLCVSCVPARTSGSTLGSGTAARPRPHAAAAVRGSYRRSAHLRRHADRREERAGGGGCRSGAGATAAPAAAVPAAPAAAATYHCARHPRGSAEGAHSGASGALLTCARRVLMSTHLVAKRCRQKLQRRPYPMHPRGRTKTTQCTVPSVPFKERRGWSCRRRAG